MAMQKIYHEEQGLVSNNSAILLFIIQGILC